MTTQGDVAERRVWTWIGLGLLVILVWALTMRAAVVPAGGALVHLVFGLSAWTGAAAIVLARWKVLTATALAACPFVATVFVGTWIWSWWLALVLVAMVAVVHDWRRALVPAVAAAVVAAQFAYLGTTALMPDRGEVEILANPFRPNDQALTLGLYLAGTAVPILVMAAVQSLRRSRSDSRRADHATQHAVEVSSVAAERARLARDLHDVVAHHVSLIAVRAETAPYTSPRLGAEARAVLAEVAEDARRALDELRAVLGVLQRADDDHPELAPQPGLADIAGLVARANAAGQQVCLEGRADAAVPDAVGYVAYRVVQEALTNARRHAPGRRVDVRIEVAMRSLSVVVANPLAGSDGRGPGRAGSGLAGMRERVAALGGTLRAEASEGVFVVRAVIPVRDTGEPA